MLLRAILGIPLIYAGLLTAISPAPAIVDLVVGAAAVLILLGLWTPLAAGAIVLLELGLAWSHPSSPWIAIHVGALAAAIALLGPGGCSVDARLFGRKQIQIP